MSHDQKPARVRIVGSQDAKARGKGAPRDDAALDTKQNPASSAKTAVEETPAPPKRAMLMVFFVVAAALGGLLQAWFLR